MAAVAALFLVGVLTGALGMVVYDKRFADRDPVAQGPPPEGRGPRPGGWDRRMRGFGERMFAELGLREEQREAIDAIVAESREESERLRREFGPRLREHMRQTRERIREVLDEEQRERFDAMLRQQRRRADRFFMGRPEGPREPPGPPPHESGDR
jgi:Spy/CpxP family protein refolding chaperone